MSRDVFERVDWSDPLIAGRFVAACYFATAAFNDALLDVEGKVSSDQWSALKIAVGHVMGMEIGDLLDVIGAQHPRLSVRSLHHLAESLKETADAYG